MTDVLYDYLMQQIGKPYISGGDDPVGGYDCSGLACEFLRAASMVRFDYRTNAQGLFEKFMKEGMTGVYGRFALSFYGESPLAIVHVGICLDDKLMVEAGGGDHTTTTVAEDIRRNAFVRVRAIKYRKDFLAVIMPRYA